MTKLFKKHHRVCPFCKNSNTWQEIISDKGINYKRQRCSCGGLFEVQEPTKENLKKFKEFAQGNYIFT